MDLSLKGKRAIVCGSTQGIGKATAIELAALGAQIVLFSRNEEKLKEVLTELPAVKDAHEILTADFSHPSVVDSRGECSAARGWTGVAGETCVEISVWEVLEVLRCQPRRERASAHRLFGRPITPTRSAQRWRRQFWPNRSCASSTSKTTRPRASS